MPITSPNLPSIATGMDLSAYVGGAERDRLQAAYNAKYGGYESAIKLVSDRYEYSRQSKLSMLETWATCLAFLVGDHWREWDERQKRLVRNYRIPSWRILMTDNQFPGIVDTAAEKLSRRNQSPRVMPDYEDEAEQQSAHKETRGLEHWWRSAGMELLEMECNIQSLLFGAGFYHDYWDARKDAKVPIVAGWEPDPEFGIPMPKIKSQTAPVGEVCCEVLSVFDVFPEPCEQWDSISWSVVARSKPLHWIREMWPEVGPLVEAEESTVTDVFGSLLPNGFQRTSGTDGAYRPQGDGNALLKEYYELPCAKYREGRHIITAGGKLLYYAEALPMPHREIPLTIRPYRYIPKRLWPMGLMETLISPQRELNRAQSTKSEVWRLQRGQRRWVDIKWDVKPESITDSPDEVIPGNFGGVNPAAFVEQAPPLPAGAVQMEESQREAMRQLSGQRDLSPDGIPAGVTAASALGLIEQQNNVRLGTPAKLGKRCTELLCKRVLKDMGGLYEEERLISFNGAPGQSRQFDVLQPDDLGNREVTVDLVEGAEDTATNRAMQLQMWIPLSAGIPPPAQSIILRDIGMDWYADAMEEAQPAIEAAQAQQMQMQQQQVEQQMQGESGQNEQKMQLEQQKMQAQQQEGEAQRQHEQQMAGQSTQANLVQQVMQNQAQADIAKQRGLPRK